MNSPTDAALTQEAKVWTRRDLLRMTALGPLALRLSRHAVAQL